METYEKINEVEFKKVVTETKVTEQVYNLDSLLQDEQNLLASLVKVRELIAQAQNLDVITKDEFQVIENARLESLKEVI